jgi:hypothetical protein
MVEKPRWRMPSPRLAKILALIFLAFLGWTGLAGSAGNLVLRPADQVAADYLSHSRNQGIAAFAAARSVNGSISLLKSIDVKPAGIGAAPFEMLEPVDDLAKEFSDVMAFGVAIILIEQFLTQISQSHAIGILLGVGCLLWAVECYRPYGLARRIGRLGRGLLILVLFARLFIPAASLAGAAITDRFLGNELDTAITSMSVVKSALQDDSKTMNAGDPEPSKPADEAQPETRSTLNALSGFFNRSAAAVQRTLSSTGTSVPSPEAVQNRLEGLPDQIVTAIKVFLVQTLLIPIVTALALFWAVRVMLVEPDDRRRS